MGKRKINTLRGKRLVTGNPNLITMNEIHVKDTQKGVEITERDKNGKLVNVNVPQSGGGDTPSQPSGGWNLTYYKIDHNNDNAVTMIDLVMFYTSPHLVNVAYEANSGKLLINGGVAASTLIADNIKAVVIADLKVCSGDKCEMSVFTDTLNALKDNMGAQIDMSVFIPITEEEYYNPATYA